MPAADSSDDRGARRGRRGRLALGAGVAVFVAMGIFWALIYTGQLDQKNPDRLTDRNWVHRTDRRCRPVREAIDHLPNAGSATSGQDRANVLDEATDRLDRLVAAIGADPPRPADEKRIVRLWLSDWHQYLQDRRAYGDALRTKAKAQPLFTVRHGQSVKDSVRNFADVNDMADCEPPDDM